MSTRHVLQRGVVAVSPDCGSICRKHSHCTQFRSEMSCCANCTHGVRVVGEFDAAFSGSRTTTSKRSSASSTESSAGGSRRRLRAASEPSSPPDWTHTALQMLKEGQQLTAISAEVGRNQFTVWNGIMRVAGDSRDDWPPLLRVVGLTAEQGLDPCEVYDAVSDAMANNSEPLTKDGQVRLKAIREYLLAKQGKIADAIRQQELMAGDKQDGTFRQLQVLQEMRHKFGHPSQLHHPSQAD